MPKCLALRAVARRSSCLIRVHSVGHSGSTSARRKNGRRSVRSASGFVKTPGGISLLILLAIVILLLLCFAAGILASRSFGRNLSGAFEKKLLLLFPRYAILKDQMTDSIGGDQTKPQMKPVLVRFDDCMRVGFETDRNQEAQMVATYLPGSPDPWSGKVVLVSVDRVEALKADFGTAVATCEQLGRGSAVLLKKFPLFPGSDALSTNGIAVERT
jgi:hypothetical protein